MFKVRVIPCLDVKDGRVVKGVNFVDLRDAGDPVEAAIAYDAAGADELCFLDITATHENRGTMLDVVRGTAEACFMPLTVGGGVRTIDDIKTDLGRTEAPGGTVSRPVVVTSEQVKGFPGFAWLTPIVGPLGTAGLVLAMVVFMLLERRELRDRLPLLQGTERVLDIESLLG